MRLCSSGSGFVTASLTVVFCVLPFTVSSTTRGTSLVLIAVGGTCSCGPPQVEATFSPRPESAE